MKLLCDSSGQVIARYGSIGLLNREPVAQDGQTLYTTPDSVLVPEAVIRVIVGDEIQFIVDQSSIDYQWKSVKEHRNKLLIESDWICSVTDYCPPNKQQWILYRQALRDITTQPNPYKIVWPKVEVTFPVAPVAPVAPV